MQASTRMSASKSTCRCVMMMALLLLLSIFSPSQKGEEKVQGVSFGDSKCIFLISKNWNDSISLTHSLSAFG